MLNPSMHSDLVNGVVVASQCYCFFIVDLFVLLVLLLYLYFCSILIIDSSDRKGFLVIKASSSCFVCSTIVTMAISVTSSVSSLLLQVAILAGLEIYCYARCDSEPDGFFYPRADVDFLLLKYRFLCLISVVVLEGY